MSIVSFKITTLWENKLILTTSCNCSKIFLELLYEIYFQSQQLILRATSLCFESGLIQSQGEVVSREADGVELQDVLRKGAAVSPRSTVVCRPSHTTVDKSDGHINLMGFISKAIDIKETNPLYSGAIFWNNLFSQVRDVAMCHSTPILMVSCHVISNTAHFTTNLF